MSSVRPVTPFQALAFSSLSVPLSILSLPIVIYVGPYYGEELGVGLGTVGTVFLFVRIIDALLDIFVGRLSDRTTWKIGRRKPWILLGAPLLLGATVMVSFPPGRPGAVYFAVGVSLYYIAWTIVQIPHLSWGQDLGGDEAGRRRMSAWRESGTVIGALMAGLLPLLIPARAGVSTAAHAIWVLGIAASVLLALGLVACLLAVPERPMQPEEPRPAEPLWSALASLPVFAAILSMFLMNTAAGTYNSVILILIEEEFGLKGAFLPFVLVQYVVCLTVVPATIAAARRLGTYGVLIGGIFVFSLGLGLAAWLTPSQPSTMLLALAAGLYVSTLLVLTPAYIAEFAAADHAAKGRDRMGEFMALYNLACKLGAAVGAGVGLIAFDHLKTGLGIPASSVLSPGRVIGCYMPVAIFALSVVALRISHRSQQRAAGPEGVQAS